MSAALAKTRLMILMAALALATLSWMFSAPPEPAAALAPTQTAWWNVANQPGLTIPPPSDVDTSKHDLYIQGAQGDAGTSQLPGSTNAQGGAQAVAAIHYELADGAAVQKLTLKIKGTTPTTPTVIACRITDPSFRSVDNGAGSDIPKYDCGTQAAGSQNAAGDIEFKDIGKLAKGPELLILLVPGKLDRVVFVHPDANSLQVSAGYTQPPSAPQPATAPDYSSSSAAAPATDSGSTSSGFVAPPPATAPLAEIPLPAPLPINPSTAGRARRVLAAPPIARSSSRIPLSPQQTRLVVGAATLASIAAFAAMVLLGPRMNAPMGGALAAHEAAGRGVGRFVRPRTGRPPQIW
ncbi:MAG: hypothetical protein ABR598_04995 [Candidatus Dormibacteria bacterium]